MGEQPNRGSFGMGLVVVLLINLLVFVALLFGLTTVKAGQPPGPLSNFSIYAGRYIGAFQLLYVLPLWMRSRRKGETSTANGMVVAACVVVLVNGICASIR